MKIEHERIIDLLTSQVGLGIAVIARDFETLYANDVIEKIFGPVVGRTCYRVFNQRTGICPGCGVREVFETGQERVVHEQSGWDARGNLVWSEIIATPIRDEKGEITAALEVVIPITKRKMSELQRTKWEQIFANSPDLVSIVDRNYVYQMVNRAYTQAHTLSSGEIVGHTIAELVGREVFEGIIKEKLDRCFGGEVVSYETWFDMRGGRRFFHVSYIPQEDDTGRIVGAIVSARDVTNLKLAEDEAQTAASHLRALMNNTDDYIMLADAEGFPVVFNAAYARIMKDALGIDMKPGIKPHTLLEDEGARAWWDGLHERVLGGEKFRVEYVHDFSGGRKIFLEVSFQPIWRTGEVAGFCEITRDVTARREADESLRQSEERYRSVIGNSPMGIIFSWRDPEGRWKVEETNPAADRTLDIDTSVLVGRSIQDALPAFAESEIMERFLVVHRDGIPWTTDCFTYTHGEMNVDLGLTIFRVDENRVAMCFRETGSGRGDGSSG